MQSGKWSFPVDLQQVEHGILGDVHENGVCRMVHKGGSFLTRVHSMVRIERHCSAIMHEYQSNSKIHISHAGCSLRSFLNAANAAARAVAWSTMGRG